MAARGVVVVSINYRVDVFGFLAHSDLTNESSDHRSGNYGLLDMVAALSWIRTNISALGGDPAQVTIAGQSAGAAAVMALLQMPAAKGLYSKAIAESGPVLPIRAKEQRAAETMGKELELKLGSAGLAGMRAVSAKDLLEAAHAGPPGPPRFEPTIDGKIVRVSFAEAAGDKLVSDVPILTGMTANEAGPSSPRGAFF